MCNAYLANYLERRNFFVSIRDWFDTETWDLDMQPDTSIADGWRDRIAPRRVHQAIAPKDDLRYPFGEFAS